MAHVSLLSVARTEDRAAPLHEHDCHACKFIGRMVFDGDRSAGTDVYVCYAEQDEGSLLMRVTEEPADYASFPVFVARAVAATEALPDTGNSWSHAVKLLDTWEEAGRPEVELMNLGLGFYDHFTVAARGSLEESPDGTGGRTFTVVGLSRQVELRHITHYVSTRHPQTHCRHEHDCCGHAYSGLATWSYVPGTNDRAIVVNQSWHLNI